MGRRSRKRASVTAPVPPRPLGAAPAPARAQRPLDRRARLEEAPKAPWAPFPLVELSILVSLVMIVLGFFDAGGKRGVLLACGFTLGGLSGMELAIREHFAGYRSHSTLLAGACAIIVTIPLYFFTRLPQEVLLIAGVLTFAIAFQVMRSAFARKTGGLGFRA
jgi:hypothetical protein